MVGIRARVTVQGLIQTSVMEGEGKTIVVQWLQYDTV